MHQLACRGAADALGLGKVGDNVGNDDLFVVAVGRGAGGVFAADKFELLGFCGLVLVLFEVALLIHLAQYVLLALLVVFNAVERVVIRRQVRYADDGRCLGNGKILCVLAEIGLRRSLDAVAALAKVNGVEVILKDLLLVVVLLKLERLEYLQQLALHGYIVLLGEIFYKLLRYRRAAEGRAAGEHVQRRVRRSEPVNALVRIKALVLYGDERILHMLGDIVAFHPYAVFAAFNGRQLLIIAVRILIIDNARLIEGEIVEIKVEARRDAGLDVKCENAHEDKPRHNADEQYRSDNAHDAAKRAAALFGRFSGNIHFRQHLLASVKVK